MLDVGFPAISSISTWLGLGRGLMLPFSLRELVRFFSPRLASVDSRRPFNQVFGFFLTIQGRLFPLSYLFLLSLSDSPPNEVRSLYFSLLSFPIIESQPNFPLLLRSSELSFTQSLLVKQPLCFSSSVTLDFRLIHCAD